MCSTQHTRTHIAAPLFLTHTLLLSPIFVHVCTSILTIRRQTQYTPTHTRAFSYSSAFTLTHMLTCSQIHMYYLTCMHPHTGTSHTLIRSRSHSYSVTFRTFSQHTHFHTVHRHCLTHVYACILRNMCTRILSHAHTRVHVLLYVYSLVVTHTHAQESWEVPQESPFPPH